MSHADLRTLGLGLLALVALAGTAGCSRGEVLAENVLLISIDTLRRDHLGCYGHDRPTSPNLDALCEEAAVFGQAISHAPSTLLSHASLLTSLQPHRHGASHAQRLALPPEAVTLAEVLSERGFRAAAFTDGGQVAYEWQLHQGFDLWHDNQEAPDTFDRVVGQGLEWLDDERDLERPFFLLLHTYEVHHPYTPAPEDLEKIGAKPYDGWLGETVEIPELQRINDDQATADAADQEFIEAAYDAEIRSMDRALGRLLEGLRERRLLESTLVVFTSDHGEELGEHGHQGWHSHTLYDELLRVPLIMRFPGERWAGRRLRRQVRLIDVAPTVADAVGAVAPSEWEGVSLTRLLRGEETPPLLAVSKIDTAPRVKIYALRTARWKLYDGRLYDLTMDPGELLDATSNHWDLVGVLQNRLAELTGGERKWEGLPTELDPETQERLEALGYL